MELLEMMRDLIKAKMALTPKPIIQKYRKVGEEKQFHYISGRLNKVRKQVRKARELLTTPEYEGVKAREVVVSLMERIDRSRYTGEKLRKLRAERGVGRRVRTA